MRPKHAHREAVAPPYFGEARPRRTSDDSGASAEGLTALRQYQGRRVSISLVDGTVLSECLLVSAGRGGVQTTWVFTEGADVFIRRADVAEIWLAAEGPRNHAA
jgi:hypothetical protein